MFRRVVDDTFNCVSIDTDTSTSDTAVILASGAAGPVDAAELEAALRAVAGSLTRQIARDGEGAETLIEVHVDQRPRPRPGQARRQGDRQLAARQDRRARRRPQLGPGRDGDRQVRRRHRHRPGAGRDPLRRPRGVPDDRRRRRAGDAVRLPARRRGPHPRVARHRRRRRAPCGAATSPTATSASTPTTRRDMRPPTGTTPDRSAWTQMVGAGRDGRSAAVPIENTFVACSWTLLEGRLTPRRNRTSVILRRATPAKTSSSHELTVAKDTDARGAGRPLGSSPAAPAWLDLARAGPGCLFDAEISWALLARDASSILLVGVSGSPGCRIRDRRPAEYAARTARGMRRDRRRSEPGQCCRGRTRRPLVAGPNARGESSDVTEE